MQLSVGQMPFSEQLPAGVHYLSDVAQFGACAHPCTLGTAHILNVTFGISLSCGESCTLVAYVDFHSNIFKMWSFFLGHML
jgi:hypothetical protein